MILEGEYLTREQCTGFHAYKYSAKDTSPISYYILQPYWSAAFQLCPKWIAPNVITISGFLFNVLSFLLFTFYDYYIYAPNDESTYSTIPSWVYAIVGFSIFSGYTLDAIDGKQARRTKVSGPLGELFDHGLDSWSIMIITVCTFSMFGRIENGVTAFQMYYMLCANLLVFYLTHWEKYNTGVLFLPWVYDASMLATTTLFILTSIYGHKLWQTQFPLGISGSEMFQIAVHLSAASSVPLALWNIYKSYRDKTGKMRTFWEAVRPLVPLAILFFTATTWIFYSPSEILEKEPRIIFLVIGTIFSNISCRLIISQISNTRCEILPWILVPFAVTSLLCILLPSIELPLLYLLSAFAFIAHLHYGTSVVQQICRHFKITAFSIKKQSVFCSKKKQKL